MSLALLSFDLDGTLVDTAAEIAEAVNRTLADLRQRRRPLDDITLLIGRGSLALMRAVLARLPAAPAPEADVLARFDAHYAETTDAFSRPYDGAHAALNRLHSHGVRLACVTNKEISHARRLLQRHDLQRYFELVIGGDSLPQAKPHASVLRYVADTLGVARDDMAHVGDSALSHEQMLTNPRQAKDFVARTGVDALAIAIGTTHGAYKFSRPPTGETLAKGLPTFRR